MSKQTAVEWLFEMLNNPKSDQVFSKNLLNKAKEIEREQIMNAWAEGIFSQGNMTAEKYYNGTYSSNIN